MNTKSPLKYEEITESIEAFPVRYYYRVLFFIVGMVVLIVTSFFIINYHQRISSPVTITTQTPPFDIIVNSSGRIILFPDSITDNKVKENTILGYIESDADVLDVIKLSHKLEREGFSQLLYSNDIHSLTSSKLGPITLSLVAFHKAAQILKQDVDTISFRVNMTFLEQKEQLLSQISAKEKEAFTFKIKKLALLREKYLTDSLLFGKSIIGIDQFNTSKANFITERENIINVESNIIRLQSEINTINNTVSNETSSFSQKRNTLLLSCFEAYNSLRSSIKKWETEYLIRVPISGRIDFLRYINNEPYVIKGEVIAKVTADNSEYIGIAELGPTGYGKVSVGQAVRIKLNSFPFQEYGVLRGKVFHLSHVEANEKLLALIKLDSGLKSSTGVDFGYFKNMSGTAEIITKERKLINTIFERFSSVLSDE